MKTLSNRSDILRQLTAFKAFLCFTLLSAAAMDARPLPVNERHSSFGYGQMLASPFPKDDTGADFPRLPSGVNGRFGNEQRYRVASPFFWNKPAADLPRLPMTSGVEHSAPQERFGNGQRVASSFSWREPPPEFPRLPSVVKHSEFEGSFGNEHMTPLKFSQNELPYGFPHLPSVVKHSAFEKWSPFTTNEPAPRAMTANGYLRARYSEGEEVGLHPDYEEPTPNPDPHNENPGVPGVSGFKPCC